MSHVAFFVAIGLPWEIPRKGLNCHTSPANCHNAIHTMGLLLPFDVHRQQQQRRCRTWPVSSRTLPEENCGQEAHNRSDAISCKHIANMQFCMMSYCTSPQTNQNELLAPTLATAVHLLLIVLLLHFDLLVLACLTLLLGDLLSSLLLLLFLLLHGFNDGARNPV